MILSLSIFGCEQETIVFPDIANVERKISVSATLDTDGGQFQVFVSKVISLPEYKHPFRNIPEVRTGRVLLYEDGELIFEAEHDFDLIQVLDREEEIKRSFLSCEGVSAKAGSVYRLEVAVDGYDPVSAIATMPHAPAVKSIHADISAAAPKHRVYYIADVITGHGLYRLYYPLHIVIEDQPESSGYYAIQAVCYYYDDNATETAVEALIVGSDDWSILADNPLLENEQDIWAEEPYEMYAFTPFLFNNKTFANSVREFTFYIPLPDDNLIEQQGISLTQQQILVKQITKETWDVYSAYNTGGLDFFNSEPITVPSNIKNGYGNFSLSNTVKFNTSI